MLSKVTVRFQSATHAIIIKIIESNFFSNSDWSKSSGYYSFITSWPNSQVYHHSSNNFVLLNVCRHLSEFVEHAVLGVCSVLATAFDLDKKFLYVHLCSHHTQPQMLVVYWLPLIEFLWFCYVGGLRSLGPSGYLAWTRWLLVSKQEHLWKV